MPRRFKIRNIVDGDVAEFVERGEDLGRLDFGQRI